MTEKTPEEQQADREAIEQQQKQDEQWEAWSKPEQGRQRDEKER